MPPSGSVEREGESSVGLLGCGCVLCCLTREVDSRLPSLVDEEAIPTHEFERAIHVRGNVFVGGRRSSCASAEHDSNEECTADGAHHPGLCSFSHQCGTLDPRRRRATVARAAVVRRSDRSTDHRASRRGVDATHTNDAPTSSGTRGSWRGSAAARHEAGEVRAPGLVVVGSTRSGTSGSAPSSSSAPDGRLTRARRLRPSPTTTPRASRRRRRRRDTGIDRGARSTNEQERRPDGRRSSQPEGRGLGIVRELQVVDPRRFELLTSSMRTRRATNCAKGPYCVV